MTGGWHVIYPNANAPLFACMQMHATGDNLDELRENLEEGIALMLERDGQTATVRLAPLRTDPVATTASPELVLA